mmetsp:Transcript_38039/g.48502  ORF Transcript_38039/g.48502 Transcript_38039/m.48502 type:complete len:551 (+) Transcript_38039:37-1689(+)
MDKSDCPMQVEVPPTTPRKKTLSTPNSTPSRSRRKMESHYQERITPKKSSAKTRLFGDGKQSSPKSASDIYSDRYIPSRLGSNLESGWNVLDSPFSCSPNSNSQAGSGGDVKKEGQFMHNMLLKSELLGIDSTPHRLDRSDDRALGSPNNLFKFKVSRQEFSQDVKSPLSPPSSIIGAPGLRLHSPMAAAAATRKPKRKIPKVPFKVLDAPALADDFYLNLVDWSGANVLAVGLGSAVYLWSACTSRVTKLCDLASANGANGAAPLEGGNAVTSVAWTRRGHHLAVGTNSGDVQVWDCGSMRCVRSLGGHKARVGALGWGQPHCLASGSRDRSVLLRDVRQPGPVENDGPASAHTGIVATLEGHRQEVCGLRWSFDDSQLASGGNDNKLFVWSASAHQNPVARFSSHTAAVKALAWSPHQHGLLASGGGTADRCIRFWNTLTTTPLATIDTGSQVCNLMWSKNINEIVSTHGYSLNQIILWRYPSMTKVATLTGHTFRVLYLAMSPDGQTIVTGAGDETLRFWNAFPGPKNSEGSQFSTGLLFPAGADIR